MLNLYCCGVGGVLGLRTSNGLQNTSLFCALVNYKNIFFILLTIKKSRMNFMV
jgi:hypothetical protein